MSPLLMEWIERVLSVQVTKELKESIRQLGESFKCFMSIMDETKEEPKLSDSRPWENKSKHRTRSTKWQAGAKMNKPKYNWSLRQRGLK